MGVSIYYAAHRAEPLDEDEHAAIARLIADHEPDRFMEAGGGPFSLWDRLDEGEVLAGSAQLPLSDPQAAVDAVTHWLALLTKIRHVLPDADWRVHVDDHDQPWDEERQVYTLK